MRVALLAAVVLASATSVQKLVIKGSDPLGAKPEPMMAGDEQIAAEVGNESQWLRVRPAASAPKPGFKLVSIPGSRPSTESVLKNDRSARPNLHCTSGDPPGEAPTKSTEFATSEAEQRIVEQVGFVPPKEPLM